MVYMSVSFPFVKPIKDACLTLNPARLAATGAFPGFPAGLAGAVFAAGFALAIAALVFEGAAFSFGYFAVLPMGLT